MDARNNLSQNIKKFRVGRGWSQEDLSEHSGLHRTYISGLERGTRNPTLGVLQSLADALGTSVSELLQ